MLNVGADSKAVAEMVAPVTDAPAVMVVALIFGAVTNDVAEIVKPLTLVPPVTVVALTLAPVNKFVAEIVAPFTRVPPVTVVALTLTPVNRLAAPASVTVPDPPTDPMVNCVVEAADTVGAVMFIVATVGSIVVTVSVGACSTVDAEIVAIVKLVNPLKLLAVRFVVETFVALTSVPVSVLPETVLFPMIVFAVTLLNA